MLQYPPDWMDVQCCTEGRSSSPSSVHVTAMCVYCTLLSYSIRYDTVEEFNMDSKVDQFDICRFTTCTYTRIYHIGCQ